jgi:hypothetical protein
VRGLHQRRAGVEQHKAAGAVRALRLADAAALPERRGLLVAQAAADGHARERAAHDVAIHFCVAPYCGQHVQRDAQRRRGGRVPRACAQVHKTRARGVRHVRDVHAAASEVVNKPAVNRAERSAPVRHRLRHRWAVFLHPNELVDAEVGGDGQASNALEVVCAAKVAHQALANRAGARVQPDDGIHQRPAGRLAPHDRGFALVRDANAKHCDGAASGPRLLQRALQARRGALHNLHRVVLHPPAQARPQPLPGCAAAHEQARTQTAASAARAPAGAPPRV